MSDHAITGPIGFIGVGVMGRPMARRLLGAGHAVIAFDSDAQALQTLAADGARTARHAREVADTATILCTSLPSPAALREAALGSDGIVHGAAVELLIDLSTVGSRAEQEVAAALSAHDIETVDAPVSGGAARASAGTLAVMAAGSALAVARSRALLELFGKVFIVGERAGQAQLLKLLNNMLSTTAFAITCEAFVAGVRAGLDPQIMLSVINAGSGRNGATLDKFPAQVLPRSFDFGFPIAGVCKDIDLAVTECQGLGIPMRIGSAVRAMWNLAAAEGGGPRDMTELFNYVEHWSIDTSTNNGGQT
jgi:2-hydroxy-3-oxopropionate reductase